MKVLVLGGGMGGLAAAHRLAPHAEVSVVQRGWRLGGKGASHRKPDGRIEEHGLHVWLGYYDNAFRLMREVYEHLDRPRTDPSCPVRTWRDAFLPADEIVVFDHTSARGHRGPRSSGATPRCLGCRMPVGRRSTTSSAEGSGCFPT